MEFPDTQYMNVIEYGLNAGIGFNAGAFTFDIRYGYAFNDVIKNFNSKNRVVSVTIGLLGTADTGNNW